MKKNSKIYYVLTYLFFIYPPFISGLVLIYNNRSEDIVIYGLVFNLILLFILFVVISSLVMANKLHMPSNKEIKYLIFGFVGNITMFLYTFQNSMNIENVITIYLVLLVVLFVHYFLISKKLQPLELWIFLPIFLAYDTIFFNAKGCSYASSYSCYQDSSYDPFLKVLFIIIVVLMLLYIIYKLLSYRLHTLLKFINYVIVVVLSIFALFQFDGEIKLILTLTILLPFFIILDFVISIINKTYSHRTILFYIRTSMIIVIFSLLGIALFDQYFVTEVMWLFVTATYVALGIAILKVILKIEVKDVNIVDLFKKAETVVKYSVCTKEDIVRFESTFTNYLDKMTFGENEYNMKVVKGDDVLGLLHSDYAELDSSLDVVQARVYFIEVSENPFALSNGLLYQVERYYKSKGVQQVKYLAHVEEAEIIQLLMKRGYIPVDIQKKGFYYFIKTL